MIKNISILLLVVLLAGCGPAKQDLNILVFNDSIAPQVLSDFESQFHCKITRDFFNGGEAVMLKLASGGRSLYDIVCIGDSEVPLFAKLDLLMPLRPENLPNLKDLDFEFAPQSSDPDHRYGIPYTWFTLGLFARQPPDGPLDESWSLIFDPAKQRGSFLLVDEARSVIAAALCYKGYNVNSTDPKELMEVRDLLIETKKRSLGFEAPMAVHNRVLGRSAGMTIGYSGVSTNDQRDPDTYFFVPREGSVVGLDTLAIPKAAPHRDLAEKFLNYLLDPMVSARNVEYLGASTPSKAARELLPPEIRNNPELYPPAQAMRRLHFLRDLGDQLKLYDELWAQIKSK